MAEQVLEDDTGDRKSVNQGKGFVRNTPQAYTHFTYESSGRKLVVCDIQGVSSPFFNRDRAALSEHFQMTGVYNTIRVIDFFRSDPGIDFVCMRYASLISYVR